MSSIKIENLEVEVGEKQILKDLSMEIKSGEVVVLLGPNGAGKSTISNVIMGNPKFKVTSGDIFYDNEKINDMPTNERAKKGIFMSFQHPAEVSGVTLMNFLRTSYNSLKGENMNVVDFKKLLVEKMERLGIDDKFRTRFLNHGFSGGEKKRSEILQLALFEPKFAILDEVDSGLDIDSLKNLSQELKEIIDKSKMGVLIITHYNKILDYIKADKVYILKNGKIDREGNSSLVKEIEEKGYN